MPKPFVIVDTCFLGWLEHFDKYCQRQQMNPPIGADKTPFGGIDYLLKSGGVIVLPNEVLKESMIDGSGRVGLGRRPNGEAYLDHQLLERNRVHEHRMLHDLLVEKDTEGKVKCFASTDDFVKAAGKRRIEPGTVAIVAGLPLGNGNGHDHTHKSRGDEEIMQIVNRFAAEPFTNYMPSIIATCDHELSDRVFLMPKNGAACEHLTTTGFLCLLKKHDRLDGRLLMPDFRERASFDEKIGAMTLPGPKGMAKIERMDRELGLGNGRGGGG